MTKMTINKNWYRFLAFITFSGSIWLMVAYGLFGKSPFWHKSFIAASEFFQNIFVSHHLLGIFILLVGLPLLSTIIDITLLMKESSKIYKIIFIIMLIVSSFSLINFLFIFLIGSASEAYAVGMIF